MNTNKFNWGEALKIDAADVATNIANQTGRAPLKPITPGRYAAFLQAVKTTVFKTGSFGVTFTYIIEGTDFKNRKISDNLVLVKADGTPVTGANGRLKRNLMAYGLPLEKIESFKGPQNEHQLGDFALVLGQPVTIEVKDDGEYQGRPSRKVNGVYLRKVSAAAAA